MQELARQLRQLGAIKFGDFRLKLHETKPDAPLSPIYLNLRTPQNPKAGPLLPWAVASIAQALLKMARKGLEYQHVTGVPRAGDPFAQALQSFALRERPGLIVMEKIDGEGGRQVTKITIGDFKPGERVLLLDDLITHADSKLEAIRVLEEANLVVEDVLVLVDREQGGREQLESHGKRLHAAMTLRQLVAFYRSIEWIDQAMFERVFTYLSLPSD
ncbi:hypothetical protein EXS71_03430 [Candidatus Uhrbacteria bacterium]|nr:hypothetical protein [Candidatus Uhrbacteria bacterium]